VDNLLISTDGGKHFVEKNCNGLGLDLQTSHGCDALGTFGPTCLQFDPQQQNVIYLAATKRTQRPPIRLGIAKSVDLGTTWTRINTGLTDVAVSTVAIDPRNGSNLFLGTDGDKVFRTTSGGSSWQSVSSGFSHKSGFLAGIRAIAIDPQNSNIVYAANSQGIHKTTNAGASWSLKNTVLPKIQTNFIAVDPDDSQTVFAGSFGAIFVSTDGSDHWS